MDPPSPVPPDTVAVVPVDLGWLLLELPFEEEASAAALALASSSCSFLI